MSQVPAAPMQTPYTQHCPKGFLQNLFCGKGEISLVSPGEAGYDMGNFLPGKPDN